MQKTREEVEQLKVVTGDNAKALGRSAALDGDVDPGSGAGGDTNSDLVNSRTELEWMLDRGHVLVELIGLDDQQIVDPD